MVIAELSILHQHLWHSEDSLPDHIHSIVAIHIPYVQHLKWQKEVTLLFKMSSLLP